MAKKLAPIPPGEILLEEFMRPLGVSRNRLARDLENRGVKLGDMVTIALPNSVDWFVAAAACCGVSTPSKRCSMTS